MDTGDDRYRKPGEGYPSADASADAGADGGADDILDISVDADELPALPQRPASAGDVLSIEVGDLDDLPPATPAPPSAGRIYPTATGAPDEAYKALAAKKGGFVAPSILHVISYLLAGAIGGLIAWLLSEPFVSDRARGEMIPEVMLLAILAEMGLFGACLGGMIGMALGTLQGISSRVWEKAGMGALWGLLIGGGGGFVGGIVGQIVFILAQLSTQGADEMPLGTRTIARAVAWSVVGIFVGLGQGFLMRSQRQIINGLIGGAIGGFIGGALFDPLPILIANTALRLTGGTLGGEVSRLVAMVVMGAACGASIRIVEEARKSAWLRVVEGPLTGKEFIIYRSPTLIGSSPKCDITLALDKRIGPLHARILDRSGQHLVEDLGASPQGTLLNGRPVQSQRLRTGDIITVGGTSLVYALRKGDATPGGG